MRTFLINLQKDADRLAEMAAGFGALGLPFERIEAIDGRTLPVAELRAFAARSVRPGRDWLPGQVGCLLSHRAAWAAIAASPDPAAAVFEDDVILSPGLGDPLRTSDWIPATAELVRLECPSNRVLLDREGRVDLFGRSLLRLRSTAWCAAGYVIRREVAQRLLDLPPAQWDSLDSMLFWREGSAVARSLSVHQFTPGYCIQRRLGAPSGPVSASNIDPTSRSAAEIAQDLFRRFGPGSVYRTLAGYRRVPFA